MGAPDTKRTPQPSSASIHGVRVLDAHTSSLAGLRACDPSVCAACANAEGVKALVVRRPMSLPFLVAVVLAWPHLLSATLRVLWGSRDLYEVMAARETGAWSTFLMLTPVWVPATVCGVLAALPAFVALTIPLCRACRARARARRIRFRATFFFVFVGVAAALLAWTGGPTLHSPVSGALFVPLALAWVALERRSVRGPARALVRGDVVVWSGDPELVRALVKRAPALTAAPSSRLVELSAWLLPVVVVVVLVWTPPLEPLGQPCTWGTYPLSYRSGAARVWGCKLPNGSRHGVWHGEHGAWSSSSSIGYDASFWFGEWHGDAELVTAGQTGLTARGRYRLGRPVGQWTTTDARGELVDVIDVSERKVLRTSLFECPPGARIELEGEAHYGDRLCVSGDPSFVGEYYVVRDLRVVERGSVRGGVRTPGGHLDR